MTEPVGGPLTDADERAIWAFGEYQRRRNFSDKTIRARQALLRAFCNRRGPGSKRLLYATTADVEKWLDSRNLSAQSRYSYLAHLHSFYRFAVRQGLAREDPTLTIDRPRLPSRLPRPMRPADLAKAMLAADPRMQAWLCLGAYQGLRRAEMAALRREDVLDAQEPPLIRVTQGKGKKDRVLPAHPRTLEALRAFGMPERGPIFVGRDGAAMTPEAVGFHIARLFTKLGITATPHRLRHTFGTTVYHRSRDVFLTQRLMGHSSVQSTMQYVGLNPDEREVDVVCGLGDVTAGRIAAGEA
ncbi:MAG: tyrosine-type recombinase/integrase [Actinomycetota bacterium]|nr:tyrosine-type recombinase/integrase [Actinomycetota bacterium]